MPGASLYVCLRPPGGSNVMREHRPPGARPASSGYEKLEGPAQRVSCDSRPFSG